MNGEQISWEQAVLWLRNQPGKQDLVKQCYYDDPIENAALRYYSSEEWQAIGTLLGRRFPCTVLDIGAGRGISSFAFAKIGCAVTALEPDNSALVGSGCIKALFEKTGLPVTVVNDMGEKLPFLDNSFDIVYGRAVLHHAKNLPLFCKEALRVLRPGGFLLFTREHVISKKEDLQTFLDSHTLHFLYKGENAYLLSEYLYAIESAGAITVKVLPPYSSPINYAPIKTSTLYDNTRRSIRGLFGNLIPDRFIPIPAIKFKLFISSLRLSTPGRLYTFVARKK